MAFNFDHLNSHLCLHYSIYDLLASPGNYSTMMKSMNKLPLTFASVDTSKALPFVLRLDGRKFIMRVSINT